MTWVEQAMVMALPVSLGVDGGKGYQSKMNQIREDRAKASGLTPADIVTHDALPIRMTSNAENKRLNWTVFRSINIPELSNYGHIHHFMEGEISGMPLEDEELLEEGDTITALSKN